MAFTVGAQFGSHEITALLGKGGMGEVYRARDLKLKREVALKFLPEEFLNDSDRLSRFQREAEVLASLNHPNIAGIHSLEEAGGARFLVLELVEGETLAERLKRGPLSIEETLRIGSQICGALEAAHDKGVVHRDLKPANIKITPSGTVKLLDFGLATLFEKNSQEADLSNSPTLMTQAGGGVILGTAAYMSPEQARGQRVSEQSDIWSFGCVLFEMLTGSPPFVGGAVTDILASIVHGTPDFKSLPEAVPATIRSLITRCLEKDRHQRLHAIADARIEISETAAAAVTVGAGAPPERRAAPTWTILAMALGIVIGSISVWMLKPGFQGASGVVRLSAALPSGEILGAASFNPIAISPDGNVLAYVGMHGATEQLYLRDIGSIEAKPIPGTDGASDPFFSPDGRWLGFFAQGNLQMVSVSGGTPQIICAAPLNAGGSWGEDGIIYFAPIVIGGLWSVPAVSGAKPQQLTMLDRSKNDVSHRWPQVLPGGKAILYTVFSGRGWDEKRVELLVLKSAERRLLVQGANTGRYISSGHLVYSRAGTLTAIPFDLKTLTVTGSGMALREQVKEDFEGALYASSDAGVLAYVPESLKAAQRRLVWVSRNGEVQPLPAPARAYERPVVSPDGRYVALGISEGVSGIWIYDLGRSTLTALSARGSSYYPIWSPDGKSVIFQGVRDGALGLFRMAVDGSGKEERLIPGESVAGAPGDVTRDGKSLVFHAAGNRTGPDIFILPLDGSGKLVSFLSTPALETHPKFSPDDRFIAYTSSESGMFEVYVRLLSGSPLDKWQISKNVGFEPIWSRDGRELFYRAGNSMMVVNVSTGPTFAATPPRLLFEGSFDKGKAGTAGYDVSPDGQRFLMVQPTELEPPATQIHVVLNWLEELKQSVPAR